MSNVTRNHKDNVFCMLYQDKKNLLSLYNAMNGTSYEKEEELEVVTLEGAICMKVKNDTAFVIDSRLNLYEQQSSANPNMPLRDLYYVAEELKRIAPPGRLHRTTKVRIPAPRFVVFYNGTVKQPERQVYKLSDLFSREEEDPELELIVTVLNINRGYNRGLLEKCESLRGYMIFVEKIRDKREAGITLEESVSQAVEECISGNILSDFFRENKEEVVEMGIFEFDQELYDKVLLEDGIERGIEIGKSQGIEIGKSQGMKIGKSQGIEIGKKQGMEKGMEIGKNEGIDVGQERVFRVYKIVQAGEADNKIIAASCDCTEEEVETIRKQLEI